MRIIESLLTRPADRPNVIPMTTRRTFVSSMVGAGVTLPTMRQSAFRHLFAAEPIAGPRTATSVAEDETYWREIQRAFDLDRTMVNLNNGGCSPAPTHVLEQMIRDLRFSNELPVDHMWRVLEPRIESVRRDLAQDFGCDPEEMAITRNASEANETMIFGLDLKKGDEVRLVGFGTFSTSKRKASIGRNPATGAEIKIPASMQAKFKPGKGLKDAIN